MPNLTDDMLRRLGSLDLVGFARSVQGPDAAPSAISMVKTAPTKQGVVKGMAAGPQPGTA